tara:strand:+ start:1517 stop:2251 length:735 start_codon:yes stop_codon:yes gene_type:complete
MGGKPLGYKIKYVALPGYRAKKPFYEIKPGVWIPRGEIPEVISYRERTKAKRKITDYKYLNSEKGFIRALFSSTRRQAYKRKLPFDLTWEEWWNHWVEQKEKYGWKCPYTGVIMTTIKGVNIGKNKRTTTDTNVSADRINPKMGYNKLNLIFCTWQANNWKKKITVDMCQAVIDIYKERMDKWYKNLVLQKTLDKIDIRENGNLKHWRKAFSAFRKSVPKKVFQRFLEITYEKARQERKNERSA